MAVGALSLSRVGEVVGVTVRNDQHVAGFKALLVVLRLALPSSRPRDDVEGDQVLRGTTCGNDSACGAHDTQGVDAST